MQRLRCFSSTKAAPRIRPVRQSRCQRFWGGLRARWGWKCWKCWNCGKFQVLIVAATMVTMATYGNYGSYGGSGVMFWVIIGSCRAQWIWEDVMITVDSQFPKIFPYGLGFLGAICIACILANIFFSIALGQINYIVEALSVNPNKIGMAQTQPLNRSFWGLHFWTCHDMPLAFPATMRSSSRCRCKFPQPLFLGSNTTLPGTAAPWPSMALRQNRRPMGWISWSRWLKWPRTSQRLKPAISAAKVQNWRFYWV